MSDQEKTRVNDAEEDQNYDDSEEELSDEELLMREIVLGLPSLRISNELYGTGNVAENEEAEARLNEQAVVAAELALATAEEAGMIGKSDEGGSSGKKKIRRRRKIGNNEEAGGSSTGETKKPKKRTELTNPPEGPPTCNVCGKGFGSWKAVFGHMRTHTDRNYRGFLPPPTFSATAEGYPILAQSSSFARVPAGEGSSTGVAGVGGSGGGFVGSGVGGASGGRAGGSGLGIDLNVDPIEEVAETTESATVGNFDLNKSPPKDEEENDKAK